MTVDGFRAEQTRPFSGWSSDVAVPFRAFVDALARALHVEVRGIERVPPGRALLVANHAFGFDIVFPMMAIWEATGRRVWGLGEHAWWRFPFLRRLATAVGTVDGTQENAAALLGRDQLVMVLPGGLREAMKPR
ncbi:MAG TPA: 1-acyl-sn-glycerol-3-phosphate acyltransferase, partial [Minicystis sp.]|nr:1-acyl-sn-glycerol-3-phosphate acyltransferase [Minicystis sp.]